MNKYCGRIRDLYEITEDKLVIVSTDKISTNEIVLSKTVPNKGKNLNAISLFWFDYTKDIVPNHIISSQQEDMPEFFLSDKYLDRTMIVKKLNMLPYEFIVRGYMAGYLWRTYSREREFYGQKIDRDYALSEKLSEPLFTPCSKALKGQNEYIPIDRVEASIGVELTNLIRDISIKLYEECYKYAYQKGLVILDTKFEFGLDHLGRIVLADELLTPDSSRYWNLAEYKVGIPSKSYVKHLIIDWLNSNKMQFDKIPDSVIQKTSLLYEELKNRIIN